MLITLEAVIDFITDEGLGPYRIKNSDPDRWKITINEPAMWGTGDRKYRCGIFVGKINEQKMVLFNAFKARSLLGDECHGDFYNFVRLVKGFKTRKKAKDYFIRRYVSRLDAKDLINQRSSIHEQESEKPEPEPYISFPDHFEKFNPEIHPEYFNYLTGKRKIPVDIIKTLKLYVDKKQERIVFPVYEDGRLICYSGRDITDSIPLPWLKSEGENKYPIWNLENIFGTTIYVFEGIGDAVYISSGIALFGVGTDAQFEKILARNFSKVVLVFDNDAPGRLAKLKWAKWLAERNQSGIYVYDYNGIVEKDFGKMMEKNVPFEIDKRIYPWNFNTEMYMRMGRII